mmetsp:Transcript_84422/g.187502  ORF Transcript_84422/g.187502 Transcript_84422/m.187502 type:complete len:279 (+) Transcript_84422:425-1261(+)
MTSSGARPCAVSCSICTAKRRARAAASILATGFPPWDTSGERLASSVVQRLRTPAGDSGATRACCHCRWKFPERVPKALCCWSAVRMAIRVVSPNGRSGSEEMLASPRPFLPGLDGGGAPSTASTNFCMENVAAAWVFALGQHKVESSFPRPLGICSKRPARQASALVSPAARNWAANSARARKPWASPDHEECSGKRVPSSARHTASCSPPAWGHQLQNGLRVADTGSPSCAALRVWPRLRTKRSRAAGRRRVSFLTTAGQALKVAASLASPPEAAS